MKLSTIQTDAQFGLPLELRTLLRETVSKASFDSIDLSARHIARPYSLYFIDAVVKSQILGEAGSNRLGALLGSGLSKLQSMMTPNVTNDIGPMLAIMAPQSGGIRAIRQLVTNAGQIQGSVLDDQNWMNDLFDALGIDDQQIQTNIVNQLESDVTSGTSQPPPAGTQPPPAGTQPPPAGTQPPPAGTQPPPAGTQPLPTGTQPPEAAGGLNQMAGAVGAERTSTLNSINDIKATLDLIASNRANATTELAKINAKIKELMARMATTSPPPVAAATESILNYIAGQMLNEAAVQRNLHIVIPESLRQFGHAHGVTIVTITEANWGQWGQKIGGFFKKIPGMVRKIPGMMGKAVQGGANFIRGMQHFAANPQYANRRLNQQQVRNDNTRIAKYAVQIATDQVREKFQTTLQQAGLDPDEILTIYPQWQKMQQRNDTSPQFAEMSQKLDAAYKLFNQDQSPFEISTAEVAQPADSTQPTSI